MPAAQTPAVMGPGSKHAPFAARSFHNAVPPALLATTFPTRFVPMALVSSMATTPRVESPERTPVFLEDGGSTGDAGNPDDRCDGTWREIRSVNGEMCAQTPATPTFVMLRNPPVAGRAGQSVLRNLRPSQHTGSGRYNLDCVHHRRTAGHARGTLLGALHAAWLASA